MKRIYTGWYTKRLRQEWIAQCGLFLRNGRRNFRFLLPTRYLIQQVRESLAASGYGVAEQVGTFDDLVDLGLSQETNLIRIDEQGKLAVLHRALQQAGDAALVPFAAILDKPGFAQSLLDAIEELKNSGIAESVLAGWVKDSGVLSERDVQYVRSFAAIYENYQKVLKEYAGGRLLDRQEGYRLAAEHLLQDGDRLLAGIETVFIDYLTVTPLQLPILEAVCRHVPHVEIFMPYPQEAAGIPILQKNRERLTDLLINMGFEHIELEAEPSGSADRAVRSSGAHSGGKAGEAERAAEENRFTRLAKSLFAEQVKPVQADGVELIPSSTLLQEVRAVAKEMKRLVKDGWQPEQIAIVTANDAAYRPLIHRVCKADRIAVRLADIRNLTEVPFVRRMLRVIGEQQADFSETATYQKHAETVRKRVAEAGLVEELYAAAAQAVITLDDLRRDVRAWQSCLDSLSSLVRAKRLFGERTVPFRVFWEEWREQLREQKVEVAGGAGSGVSVLRPAEVRGLSFRAVFVLGLNEDSYPKKPSDHWLLDRLEQAAVRNGYVLQRREQFELQNLLFRSCLLAAEERLYLSFLSPEADERNLRSPYLEAVMRCIAEGDWKHPARFASALSHLPISDRWEELSGEQEWRERAAVWLGGPANGEDLGEAADILRRVESEMTEHEAGRPTRLIGWRSVLERIALEEERESGGPSRFAGRLSDPAIHARLQEIYSSGYTWSVSKLNRYAVCPFQFFADHVLRIDPKEALEDGIPVDERGSFLHELTQRLLLPLTGESRVEQGAADKILADFDRIFEETCENWKGSDLTESLYWPIEKTRLQQEMRTWLERELEMLVQSRLRPVRLEWSFGGERRTGDAERKEMLDPQSTEERIGLPVGKETMWFRGRIDRVDLAEDGSRYAILDYKTSLARYKGSKDLENGTNWQVPLYLAIFEKWAGQQGQTLSALGGGYQKLAAKAEAMVGVWAEDAKSFGLTAIKRNDVRPDLEADLQNALLQVANQRDALRQGVFDAQPRADCDPYCPFGSVCRFDGKKKGELHEPIVDTANSRSETE
ncbi:PD-(D/E)XK nuclease family protein [Effusibacillus dendaii]|uniref:PD-(D/E)XK endonuclease-like domain-containing protein n=1 Tax=Effusibacillus dendaii TaxID=2743772 RepID=A0A7I8D9D8_9BACL|nr:PD-(D/E)XK nuclease family protein [Effusibacillus dendaii]BCJ86758.1 hypothetical protein skT53_17430 [Effusibacillus dendaii]